jgi:hypothetical protein
MAKKQKRKTRKRKATRKATPTKRRKARHTAKRRKTKRKAPRTARRAAPKRRKKRKLSAAHLAKMQAGRKRAAAAKRKRGPMLVARMGESARPAHYSPPLAAPRFRTNPRRRARTWDHALSWWKFCVHNGPRYSEQVGLGSAAEAATKARTLCRPGCKVVLLGPYQSQAAATAAA